MKMFSMLALFVIAADQFTKKLAVFFLRDMQQSITIIPDFFSFTYAENRGVAFGMEFAPPFVLLMLTGAIVLGVLVFVARSRNRTPIFLSAFGLIAGGGIGNMIDRIASGRVTDFIYFDLYKGELFGHWVSLWPIFNVADSAITIGACMLVLFYNRIFPDTEETRHAG
ncbi:signal peptidase II [Pelodictyon luteolum]|uniref:Lipoprotein signal peptidase n=1 Tax=Chlorobium luteolum (strain DSM 273 / BCRC 81028 / 2530) TaxID=319225 RepID=LSPA_CHLL3|nr:signal peptidase II [Pelodictyon luteolum]Q3B5L1.1 RecName: Full=Lipoprotein signal peptidase; AltName: Full=Prolipoprotein signal peptidase; AltName: Full=Signal peptidase II; Short=SPase II [Pelodictyon luteolum DSM 273]ABB23370.1 signal peptidase II, Aspartic peptidase, MEROPS family A08 [Pelodictyon luteolum DSM 273]